MLVLSRRVGEKITIGDDVVVTILAIKGNQVRVGIDAPASVTILRSELEPYVKPEVGRVRGERVLMATS
jgi:carbon storage regulator